MNRLTEFWKEGFATVGGSIRPVNNHKRKRVNGESHPHETRLKEQRLELRNVVGQELSDTELDTLLRIYGYNVHLACNAFFDQGRAVLESVTGQGDGDDEEEEEDTTDRKKPMKQQKLTTKMQNKKQNTIVLLDSDEDEDDEEEEVESDDEGFYDAKECVKTEWPKCLAKCLSYAEMTYDMDWGECKEIYDRGVDLEIQVKDEKPDSKKKKQPRGKPSPKIVRVKHTATNQEFGRLDKRLAPSLQKLMSSKLVSASAKLLRDKMPYGGVSIFTKVEIEITINVLSDKVFSFFPSRSGDIENIHPLAEAFFELVQSLPCNNDLSSSNQMLNSLEPIALDDGEEGSMNDEDDDVKPLSQEEREELCENENGDRDIELIEDDDSNNNINKQADPDDLAVSLRPHQRTALKWMLNRENPTEEMETETRELLWKKYHFMDPQRTAFYVNIYTKCVVFQDMPKNTSSRCGILGDEMGMGKTISILALILQTRGDFTNRKTPGTLIVCPMSLIAQWERELIDKVSKEKPLRILRYHGSDRSKVGDLSSYEVVLTTYGTAQSEFNSHGSLTPSPLFKPNWYRIVLDEAHMIKNKNTDCSKSICSLRGERRWCLTGTPMQNSIDDLFALLLFLKHEPWSSYRWWNQTIRTPFEKGTEEQRREASKRIHSLLYSGLPLMLRRRTNKRALDNNENKDVKDEQVQEQEPGLGSSQADHLTHDVVLPPIKINNIEIDLSPDERVFYDALLNRSRADFKGLKSQTTYAEVLTLLLRLRQACNHVYLVMGSQIDEKTASQSSLSSIQEKTKFLSELREKFIQSTSTISSSSSTSLSSSSLMFMEDTLNRLEQEGGMPGKDEECPICLDRPEQAVILKPCGHIFCELCLRDSMEYLERSQKSDTVFPCPSCRTIIEEKIPLTREPKQSNRVVSASGSVIKSRKDLLQNHWRSSSKLDQLADYLETIARMNQALESGQVLSAKRDVKLAKLLLGDTIGETPYRPVKVLVFSQWTFMLDLVEIALRKKKLKFNRLDGSMTTKQRESEIDKFNMNPKHNVFLISLKAGCQGLNLTSANVVFLVDSWFNPAVDNQAIGRAHRIGQTRPVHVYRLIAKDTVDEKVLSLQKSKAQMTSDALEIDQSGNIMPSNNGRLSLEELVSLLN